MSVADRVRETLTGATDFTGQKGASATITLPGSASSGYDPFSRRYTNGTANIPVIIAHRSADEWQACLCTYTSSNLLTVNTIVATSEAADAAPSFTAGDKDIYVAALARNIVPAPIGSMAVQYTTETLEIEAFAPSVTHVAVDVGSGYYRHVPSIYMRNGTGAIMHLFNASSPLESATEQKIAVRRTSDDGDTWSPIVEEFTDANYSSNPLPAIVAGSFIHGDSHLEFFDDLNEEWATINQRAVGNKETAYLCRRDASAAPSTNKWQNFQLLFDSSTQEPVFTSSLVTTAPAGFSFETTIDGVVNCAPYLSRPTRLNDGKWAIPAIMLNSFGNTHFCVVFYSTASNPGLSDWRMSSPVPFGDVDKGRLWEPTIIQTERGGYRLEIRDTSTSKENKRRAISESVDLESWSPAKHSNANIHSVRMWTRRKAKNRYLGAGITHATRRNGLVLMLSRDGELFSEQGLEVGNETYATEIISYSDIDENNNKLYVVYTQGGATDSAPSEVHFSRCTTYATGKLPMMGSVKNAIEDSDPTYESTIAGDILTIPPGGGMMWVPGGMATVYTRRWRVHAAPSTISYTLFTVGTADRFFPVELRSNGKIYFNNVDTGVAPTDPTKWQTTQILLNRRGDVARVYDVSMSVPRFSQLGSGDTYNTQIQNAENNIYFDASGCFDTTVDADSLTGGLSAQSGVFSTITENGFPALTQQDVGSQSNQVPLNQHLGALAYVDSFPLVGTAIISGGTIDDATIGATTRAAGNFTTLDANGNVTLGNATSDTITATGRFNTDLVPSTDNARDLGTSALKWKQIYATTFTEGTLPVISQSDIGTTANQVPLSGYLGSMAYLDADNISFDDRGTNVAEQNLAVNKMTTVTIDADTTLTTTVPRRGSTAYVTIITSGANSRTVTFGTGFKSTGTLATGTDPDRRFVFEFLSDGTNLIEVSRTAAITY